MAHTSVIENGLPLGTSSFKNQVAGHAYNDNKSSRTGLLIDGDGHVLKPLEGKIHGKREVSFYKEVFSTNEDACRNIRPFISKYFGTRKIPSRDGDVEYIVLSNAISGMINPCIMDVKIGKRTWDPEASVAKQQHEMQKYVESRNELSFCIPGFQYYDIQSGKFIRYGKEFGKNLNRHSTVEVFKTFLNLSCDYGNKILEIIISKLKTILQYFENQRKFKFYSSSILLAYDANNEDNMNVPDVTVTMIDFAHAFSSLNNDLDFNYIEGISNLIKLLQSL